MSMAVRETYWESLTEIPEPDGFAVKVTVDFGGHAHTYATKFAEHGHDHGDRHSHDSELANDALYAPKRGGLAVLRHLHTHRHGNGSTHVHLDDHDAASSHQVAFSVVLAV
jgi:hypothetical protein